MHYVRNQSLGVSTLVYYYTNWFQHLKGTEEGKPYVNIITILADMRRKKNKRKTI
jgi:hypothetical protein